MNRPEGVNAFQTYVLERLDDLTEHLAAARVEIGCLRGRARAWGAVPGLLAVAVSAAALYVGLS